jgi:hypothetical protein
MSLEPIIEREMKVRKGLESIIRHLDTPVWTLGRWISFGRVVEGGKVEQIFRLVHSAEEALSWYKVANFLDCRIRAYHDINDDYTNMAPSTLLVDIDRENFKTWEEFEQCISETRTRLKELLGAEPTDYSELWTGNGVHIVLTQSAIIIEDIKMFKKLEYLKPSVKFMRFEEQLLTDGKADPSHSSNISFGNCMLRIPGSLNSGQIVFEKGELVDIHPNAEVVIRQLWDGKNKPSIKPLMMSYYIWLQSDVMEKLDRQMELGTFTKWFDNHEIWWIENLLETPIDDNRWYCVWHILVPYLINIKGLSESEASDIISTWLDKCSLLKRLNFSRRKVGYTIRGLKDYHLPIGRDNLERDNLPLFEKLRDEGVIW